MEDQAQELREMVKNSGEDILSFPESHKGKNTRVICVASGKGGVGKTNMSINMAIAYAKAGKKVTVLDADLGLANVNVVLGVIPKYNLYHVIKGQKSMSDIIMDTDYGIQIVGGASGFSRITNLSDEERKRFIQELMALSDSDIIIIDASAGVGPNVLSFIEACDDAVIVTTPEPTAITDAYGIIKIMSTEINDLDMSIKLLVNRAKSVTEARKVADRIINITGQFLNIKLDYLGFVYEDPVVPAAVRKQQPFLVLDPKSKAAGCMDHLINRLENVKYREGSGVSKFLKRFFSGNR